MDKDVQGASGLHLTVGGAAVHSRSEDEEPAGGKGIKRTVAQAFSGGVPKRRSSSRSIKRKKFNDELVESSLAKSSTRVKGPPVIEPARYSVSEPSSNEKKKVSKSSSTPAPPSGHSHHPSHHHQKSEEEQAAPADH